MVSLWNDIRISNNMPPMGFINPFLYWAAANYPLYFNDITSGDNVSHKHLLMTVISSLFMSLTASTPSYIIFIIISFNCVHIPQTCGMSSDPCCVSGFEAAAGWDAVTGLGSPRFNKIKTLVANPFPTAKPSAKPNTKKK